MNKPRIKFAIAAWFASATCVVVLTMAVPGKAQDINGYTRRETEATAMENKKDEALRRDAALKQMNEDFKRLQELNLDLSAAYPASGSPNYKRLSDDSAEIKTRASRLRNNLMMPPAAKEEKHEKIKEEPGQDPLQSSVMTLNVLIKSFASNPVFKKDTGVDHQQVSKARRDLDDIIEISDKLKKAAEKMSKSPGKTN